MKFNVRSALSAVGSLAEGTLAGQIEAQQEQERRDAQDYQRQLQLYEIGAGQQSDLLHARLGVTPNIAEGERAGFESNVIDAQIKNPYANAPNWLSQHVGPSARKRFGLDQFSPHGGSDVGGIPAPAGDNGGRPGLTPGPTTTQPVETGQPRATPANTPPPATQPQTQAQTQTQQPALSSLTPGFLHATSPFALGNPQLVKAMGPFGPLLQQALTPPPAATQPVGQAPLAATGPSGGATGAAGPSQTQQPANLQSMVQPAQPTPQPVEQKPVTFTGVAGTYSGVGANVLALRQAYNDLTHLNAESEKIDWAKFKEDDPVGYAKAVGLFQHEPSYESAKTPEGYQALIEHNDQARGLLLTAPRKATTAGEASALRAKTGDITANRQALQKVFDGMSPTAPLSEINKTIADYGLTDDFKGIQDVRGRVFGKRIDDELTKINGHLANASHMSPGELQALVGRANGLRGYRPGSLKIPYSEYRKLSIQDRANLVAKTQVSIDTHLAREDTHQLAPLIRERARVGIQESQARIDALEKRAQQLNDKGGLSAASDLRSYMHQEDRAANEVQQYLRNPDHAGVQEHTMEFIDQHFGPWLHANNPTLPDKRWENELKHPKGQSTAEQTLSASPPKFIGYIRGVLKLHSLEVMRRAKQDALTKKFGGVPDEPSAPATSGGGWPAGWNSGAADQMYAAMTGFGWTPEAARQEILRHPNQYGGR